MDKTPPIKSRVSRPRFEKSGLDTSPHLRPGQSAEDQCFVSFLRRLFYDPTRTSLRHLRSCRREEDPDPSSHSNEGSQGSLSLPRRAASRFQGCKIFFRPRSRPTLPRLFCRRPSLGLSRIESTGNLSLLTFRFLSTAAAATPGNRLELPSPSERRGAGTRQDPIPLHFRLVLVRGARVDPGIWNRSSSAGCQRTHPSDSIPAGHTPDAREAFPEGVWIAENRFHGRSASHPPRPLQTVSLQVCGSLQWEQHR